MSQAKDELVARAQDPNAELETLHQLAQNYPGLRPYIAANPRTYPALLEWLGTLGDPAVDAALASRGGQPQSAQSPQGEPQLAVVSPPGTQPGSPSAGSSEAPTQVTLPRSLQPGSASSGTSGSSGTSAISATSSRSAASASSAFSAAGANTQVDRFRASGDPTVSDPTFHPTQAIPSQSPARPVQPALQQTFQQSANVSQAQSPVIPAATQASAATDGGAGVFGVGTEDDEPSTPSSFLTSNRILLILAFIVIIILIFLASWYFSGGDGRDSATGSQTQATAQSGQGAGAAPSAASASPKASATPSASATPTLKAPAPNGAQEMSAFNAPSGNITCTLGDNEVTCTINEHAATPACPASRPLTVKVGTNGQSSQSCGSTFTPSGSSLNYNFSAKNSSFACTSTENGMQCWSQVSGEGFTLSREGVESTTHGR
ncbi:hypothetical protein [Actinomyces sp. ZJ308]|uniref:variant leucine-rich repeat-containing protein n=1 Tax=Actinomyces sp. ZJ308 TaxID=2708342 RepID=UPI001421BF7F|nr:hypothetical protein [Actinomyces sp. ZJ308]